MILLGSLRRIWVNRQQHHQKAHPGTGSDLRRLHPCSSCSGVEMSQSSRVSSLEQPIATLWTLMGRHVNLLSSWGSEVLCTSWVSWAPYFSPGGNFPPQRRELQDSWLLLSYLFLQPWSLINGWPHPLLGFELPPCEQTPSGCVS